MTIVAAALDRLRNAVVMGSDSLVTSNVKVSAGPKFRRMSGWLVGHCGPVLWRTFDPGPFDAPEEFAARWWTFARERGHGSGDAHVWLDGAWLLARPGELAIVTSDAGVLRPIHDYATIGSGESTALGALVTALTLGRKAKEAVSLAIGAAILHEPGCGGPVHVEVLRGK